MLIASSTLLIVVTTQIPPSTHFQTPLENSTVPDKNFDQQIFHRFMTFVEMLRVLVMFQ